MGVALLLLAVNYSMHFFFEIRYLNPNAAILMNLTTYFLCYWLFSSALTSLLNRFYITRKRFGIHIGMWISLSLLSGIVLFVLPEGMVQKVGLIAMAIWLIIYGLVLSRRLLLAYKKAVTILNNSFSDDIGTYIHWMSVFTYLLGHHIRRRMRGANFSPGQIYFYMDSFFSSILHLPLYLLPELPAVLRASGKRDGK